MDNRAIAKALELTANLLELNGANRFKVAAYNKASRAIKGATVSVAEIADDAKALKAIEGIGSGIADSIAQLVERGSFDDLDALRAEIPLGLTKVLELRGLGPKTVRALWKERGIESVEDLKAAIEAGTLEGVPNLGTKKIAAIGEAIAFLESSGGRTEIGRALPIAESILEGLRGVKGVERAEYAGSMRRGRETVGDLDFLVAAKADAVEAIMDAFTGLPSVTKVLARGETKSSILLDFASGELQADLRVVEPSAFGAALMYFTGSKDHNVRLRERAIKRDMRLNEYGLYPSGDDKSPVASETEEAIYSALDLKFIEPERREDRGELEGELEPLIELGDIRAELHAHTTASDGRLSIKELAEQAKARGFHTIAVTDHSKSSGIANGLSEERLRAHIEAIRGTSVKGITILAGSEVDILSDGSLDYDDELLGELDVVVASPHVALDQDAKSANARILKAIEHPLVHIIGHPRGRLINRREGLPLDLPMLAAAAKEHGVALELNSNWQRLDLNDTDLRTARAHGALITIDCDVHAAQDFDNLRYGVLTARRGGLTAEGCPNTWGAKALHDWLKAKR